MGSKAQRETIDKVVRLNRSMSGGGVLTITLRDRQQTKVEGIAFKSRIDDRKTRQLRDGESTLHYMIRTRSGSEQEIAVDRMGKVTLRPLRHLEPVD